MFSILIYPFMRLQAPTNSPFATLPSFTLYSAKVACPKDHVRAYYHRIGSLSIFDD